MKWWPYICPYFCINAVGEIQYDLHKYGFLLFKMHRTVCSQFCPALKLNWNAEKHLCRFQDEFIILWCHRFCIHFLKYMYFQSKINIREWQSKNMNVWVFYNWIKNDIFLYLTYKSILTLTSVFRSSGLSKNIPLCTLHFFTSSPALGVIDKI